MACGYGVQEIGYVVICYATCDAISSLAFGALIKRLHGRIPVFIFGAIINIVMIIVLFEWTPNPEQGYVVFIVAGLWGMADAIWQTQINGSFVYHAYRKVGLLRNFGGKCATLYLANYSLEKEKLLMKYP